MIIIDFTRVKLIPLTWWDRLWFISNVIIGVSIFNERLTPRGGGVIENRKLWFRTPWWGGGGGGNEIVSPAQRSLPKSFHWTPVGVGGLWEQFPHKAKFYSATSTWVDIWCPLAKLQGFFDNIFIPHDSAVRITWRKHIFFGGISVMRRLIHLKDENPIEILCKWQIFRLLKYYEIRNDSSGNP